MDAAVQGASRAAAQRATHMQALVDLSQIAKQMGDNYYRAMQDAISASRRSTGTPSTLFVKAGEPLDMFSAASWPACFVQFLHGDCSPYLQRPCRVDSRNLFSHLMWREELEYHLPSDKNDESIPGVATEHPHNLAGTRPSSQPSLLTWSGRREYCRQANPSSNNNRGSSDST